MTVWVREEKKETYNSVPSLGIEGGYHCRGGGLIRVVRA